MTQRFPNPSEVVARLREFQRLVRDAIVATRGVGSLAGVARSSSADTIYAIDAVVDPILEAFCEEWSRDTPMVVIAEGLEDEHGVEGPRVFPRGTREEDAAIRLIVDPIDGTRGIMYDKRAAWCLAGVAPNKGPATRLRDIRVAMMTELPTSKMGHADVLWAVAGQGAHAVRESLISAESRPLPFAPSRADTIAHGFAQVCNFFPGTKVLSSQIMEYVAEQLIGKADVTRATVFDDQYISTGGQFYEMIVGHDRFCADLRPIMYAIQGQPEGLCCHPYDCATWLVATEAGIHLTDGLGRPLDGPMDTTSAISWAAFANESIRRQVEPLVTRFLRARMK